MKTLLRAAILSLSAASFSFHGMNTDHAGQTSTAARDVSPVRDTGSATGFSPEPYDGFAFIADPALAGSANSALMNAPQPVAALEQPVSLQLQPAETTGEGPLPVPTLQQRPGNGALLGLKPAKSKDLPFQLFNPHAPVIVTYRPIYVHSPVAGGGQYRSFPQPGGMRNVQFQGTRPQSYHVEGGGYHSSYSHPYFSPMR